MKDAQALMSSNLDNTYMLKTQVNSKPVFIGQHTALFFLMRNRRGGLGLIGWIMSLSHFLMLKRSIAVGKQPV